MPEGSVAHAVLTRDGITLRAMHCLVAKPKGTVIVLTGRSDFIERYFETFHDLLKRGYAVASFDWRGQGGSDRLLKNRGRGHITDFAQFDEDLDAVMAQVVLAYCPKPYFALAHSTGGHILLRCLGTTKWFSRAVITAPLLALPKRGWPDPVIHFLTLSAKLMWLDWAYVWGVRRGTFQRRDFERNPLTSDAKRWARDMTTLETFPQLGLGGPTFGWLRACMKSLHQLHRWPRDKGPTCPTMIVMAGNEFVVDNQGTRNFVERVPGITVLTIADSKHEILMETKSIRERFWAAFDAFMEG